MIPNNVISSSPFLALQLKHKDNSLGMNKAKKNKNIGIFVHAHGVSFRVWAPNASGVGIVGTFNGFSETPLESEGDGNWSTTIKNAEAGQEYKYVIHNGDWQAWRNDPRALAVMTSAGNSVIPDTDFDWEGDDYHPPTLNNQVIYELHIGTFHREDPGQVGTFRMAAEKLDYLAALGVTTIEIMPITSMPSDRGWGYAPNYIYAVESLYGGRREFQEFVKQAHKHGIGVVLDVVYNHFGPIDLDLWQFDGWSENNMGGIYFYNNWRAETPWGQTRPDYGREEVRDYILDNVKMWLRDCHVDGLRLDSTIYLRNVKGWNNDPEHDIPEAWWLMQDITRLCRKIKPDCLLVAEDISGNSYITKNVGEGGAGFMAQWEVGFPNALRQPLNAINDVDRNIVGLADMLWQRYNGDAFQRVVYSESHDNDANGRHRLDEEVSPGNAGSIFARKRSLLAAGIVLTAPGVPMLFQGQEFMQDGAFNDWKALDWDRAEKFKGIVHAHTDLIALRKNSWKNTAGLTGGGFNVLHVNDESKVLVYHRWENGGPADDTVIIFNFMNHEHKDYVVNFPRDGTWRVRFDSSWKGYSPDFKSPGMEECTAQNLTGVVRIAPYSLVILSQDS